MRLVVAIMLSLCVTAPVMLPDAALAQRRTLFDLLFGNDEPQQQQQAPQQQQQQQRSQPRQQAPAQPRAQVTVSEPAVDKNEDATRLMVFGDSLAVDLARALQRAYAEDPNMRVIGKGVGSSGFVRDDFYDWNASLEEEIAADSFDLAVIIIGINDRQPIGGAEPLTESWKSAYQERLNRFLGKLRQANKPTVWVGLPPMRARSYSAAINEISSLHRLAAVSNGAEFIDIYERFTDENGNYTDRGPNLDGQTVSMRKSDGIHFSTAGSDKVAFYVQQALKRYYSGGRVTLEVADPLEGTDAQSMVRLPFQGNGQIRLLEVAGAVLPLTGEPHRASELVSAEARGEADLPFELDDLMSAPTGRADAFGVGIDPGAEPEGQAGAR